MKYALIFLSIPLLCLPACLGRKKQSKQILLSAQTDSISNVNDTHQATTDPDILQDYQARLFDVTPVLGAELKRGSMSCDQLGMQWVLEYEIEAQSSAIIEWYNRHLEYSGWVKIRKVHTFATMLHFSKPGRKCQIYIVPDGAEKHTILIWVFEYSLKKKNHRAK